MNEIFPGAEGILGKEKICANHGVPEAWTSVECWVRSKTSYKAM
jgi:hypothetical protein